MKVSKGDPVEVKAKLGLGGWERAEVVSRSPDGRRVLVKDRRGHEFMVAARHVRPIERAPAATALRVATRKAAVGIAKRLEADRSAAYLAYVRTHPCAFCGQAPPSDPHHIATGPGESGMGRKVPDFQTVPLCRTCHDSYHRSDQESPLGAVGTLSRSETERLLWGAGYRLLVRWTVLRAANG